MDVRKRKWELIESVCPQPLVKSLLDMRIFDRCKFILNALYVDYEKELKAIYDALANYIHFINNEYQKQLSRL